MRFLFIADPVHVLKKKADTSFAFLQQTLKEGHEAYWATDKALSFRDAKVWVNAQRVTSAERDETPILAAASPAEIEAFHVVFIRKDPPFDSSYIQLCWILSFAETKTYFINRPSLLLRYHEKILPIEAVANGFLDPDDIIPTFFGDTHAALEYFEHHSTDQVVVKPFWGYGGSDVSLYKIGEFKSRFATTGVPRDQIIQPFQKEIVHGDRRVFFVNGDVLASVVRVPKPGSFISNLAQGGSALARPLRLEEQRVLQKLGRFLKSVGIHLAGADVIGDKISEVNITSPTGIRAIESVEGRDYSQEIVRYAQSCAFYGGT